MKKIKALEKLAESVNGKVEVIRFHGNGKTNKGYAIIDSDNNELVEIEPVIYSNGDRWKVANRTTFNKGILYVKTLSNLETKIKIKAGHTGTIFRIKKRIGV